MVKTFRELHAHIIQRHPQCAYDVGEAGDHEATDEVEAFVDETGIGQIQRRAGGQIGESGPGQTLVVDLLNVELVGDDGASGGIVFLEHQRTIEPALEVVADSVACEMDDVVVLDGSQHLFRGAFVE